MNEFNRISADELKQIEGGGWFSNLVNDIEGAAKAVGNAIENAAKGVVKGVENEVTTAVGAVGMVVKGVVSLF